MIRLRPLTIDPQWAWSAYQPTAQAPWDLRRVGHLYRRAAFGANGTELREALQAGPQATIDRLLAGGPGLAEFDQESGAHAATIAAGNNHDHLRAWWLHRLLHSPHPLQEKLTLFWHNHFATSIAKVQHVAFMLRQNQLFRRHALGDFSVLLQEVSKDPAMLIWLDNVENKKGQPNENYARELMELFSLGVGHYTEADIREAARAFTGWMVRKDQFHLEPAQHDDGWKHVFGQRQRFRGEDIVRLCLEQTASAHFMARKLFRALVSETHQPDAALLEPLAEELRESGWKVGVVVERILRSNLFFSPHAYRQRVKSPTEFAVGIIRALEGRTDLVGLAQALDELGQKLFAPPSVKGWEGGAAWLNSTTLLLRHNLAAALTSTEDNRFGRRCDPAALYQRRGPGLEAGAAADFFIDLFLQGDLPESSRQRLHQYAADSHRRPAPSYWSADFVAEHRLRSLCHLVLTQAEFQLC